MEEGITLSENHGLNPTMDLCLICGEAYQILLLGKLPNDEAAPLQVCTGQVCQKCIDKLIENNERLFIEIDENITGRYIILSDDVFDPSYIEKLGDKRVIYTPIDAFKNTFDGQD